MKGKLISYEEAVTLSKSGNFSYVSQTFGPIINYNRESLVGLPNVILEYKGKYFLLTPEEFVEKEIQEKVQLYKGEFYGQLVSEERVGS